MQYFEVGLVSKVNIGRREGEGEQYWESETCMIVSLETLIIS